MKRITTVLKESEAINVRKAVCAIAGAEHIVITPIPYRMCGADMVDLYSEKIIAESRKQVRLDVTADDSIAACIVVAIRKIANAAKIVLASRLERRDEKIA